ncbi:MAG: TIGR00645 family protein [Sporichthyaceae bacterium]
MSTAAEAPKPDNRSALKKTEHTIELALLISRWLLAPLYFMLMLVLVVFSVSAWRELWHLFTHITSVTETELILAALALIDLSLVGGLLVMVAMSGYESFVSKFDVNEEYERPAWLGKLDLGTVKLKLAASIVSISGIHLLKNYMDPDKVDNEGLLVLAVVHLTFVGSALLLAIVDRTSFQGKH